MDGANLIYIQPHMHLRDKDYELRVTYPTGESKTVFKAIWFNPDASTTIWWSDQNWDETQSGFLGLDANKVFIPSGPSLLPRGATAGPTLAAVQATGKK